MDPGILLKWIDEEVKDLEYMINRLESELSALKQKKKEVLLARRNLSKK